jgi:hypothetical protein
MGGKTAGLPENEAVRLFYFSQPTVKQRRLAGKSALALGQKMVRGQEHL